ncbi:MAG: aromatic ring-hydroxylating oxygenase subunit alpha [Acidimicrobiales bacterium]
MDADTNNTAPGAARCPGPTTRDLILGDSTPTPPQLLVESPVYLGSTPVSFDDYTSADRARDEHDHLWSRVWQWACRHEHIPEPGDYYVYDIGDRSALIVRGHDGEIRAFANSCLHRGTMLKPPGSCGMSQQLRCPFHGWTWSTEGRLVEVPGHWDFPDVNPDTHSLPELRVASWGGFVFVNWDHDAAPLEDHLGVMIEHFADWDLSDRYIEVHARKRLPANWKASASAFLEAYHVLETHPQGVMTTGDANAHYDVFGPTVSRFVHTTMTTSPHIAPQDRPTEQEMLAMVMSRHDGEDHVTEIPDGERARDVYARSVQQNLGERYGRDFSQLSVSETIDSIEYFLFPNAFFFPGLQFPMVYRFRPDGHDPDHSIFDMLVLRPNPTDGPPPFPAEPFDLDVDDSYTTTPGIAKALGMIYDQDTSNLAAMTRGFKASATGAQTLGDYQEVRVRHLHDGVAQWLADGRAAADDTP